MLQDWIDFRGILVLVLIFVPLEQLSAARPHQKIFRRQWLSDVVYLFINGAVIRAGSIVVIWMIVFIVGSLMPTQIGEWTRSQPMWLQAVEAVFVADMGFYAAHRTFHAVPFLWKFHAVHHSIEELDWLAAHRVHPVDQIVTSAASYLPLFALGFSAPAIAIKAGLYFWQAHLIHSNTRIGFGPLKWVFASPQFHHWHHANERTAYDKNFAGQLSIVDAIFGTLRVPSGLPGRYGVDDPVPDVYHKQVIYPFLPQETQRMQQETAS